MVLNSTQQWWWWCCIAPPPPQRTIVELLKNHTGLKRVFVWQHIAPQPPQRTAEEPLLFWVQSAENQQLKSPKKPQSLSY